MVETGQQQQQQQQNNTNVRVCHACGSPEYVGQCINRQCPLFRIGRLNRTNTARKGLASVSGQGFSPLDMAKALQLNNRMRHNKGSGITPELIRKMALMRAARIRYLQKVGAVSAGSTGPVLGLNRIHKGTQ